MTRWTCFLAAAAQSLLFVVAAQAADLTVTSDLDDGAGTLRALAATAASGDRILIPGDMVVNVVTQLVLGGKSLDLVGLGAGATIRGAGADRLLYYSGGGGRTLGCYNLAFTNGAAGGKHGGVAYVAYCKGAVFSNCVFTGNSALDSDGGVFYCGNNNSTVAATNCVFVGNTAKNGGVVGGNASLGYSLAGCRFEANAATLYGGVANATGPLLFSQCFFTNNTAKWGGVITTGRGGQAMEDCTAVDNRTTAEGGVIYTRNPFAMLRCSFVNNYGRCGGVLHKYNGLLTARDCLFEGNTDQPSANWCHGGVGWLRGPQLSFFSNCVFRANRSINTNDDLGDAGVFGTYGEPGEGLEVWDCTFDGNHAERVCGVMRINNPARFRNCTFTRNSTGMGDSAVAFVGVGDATNVVGFTNCTFFDNAAGTNAASGHRRGVIYVNNTNGCVNLDFCTIVSNRTSDAAVYVNSTAFSLVSINSTVVAFNTTHSGATDDLRGAILALGHSAISEAETGFTKLAAGAYANNLYDCTEASLKLSPPADNDTQTTHPDGTRPQTMAFGLGSVLRDRGGPTPGVATDARGFPRPDVVSAVADIGAYEFVPEWGGIIIVH
ncbi:MAG: choice-of-anchor Q domain-containing protein [Kiritimatiellia bacterium]|jgi:hypothetical protein